MILGGWNGRWWEERREDLMSVKRGCSPESFHVGSLKVRHSSWPCWGVKWEMKAGGAAVEYVTVCHQNGRDPGG